MRNKDPFLKDLDKIIDDIYRSIDEILDEGGLTSRGRYRRRLI